MNRRGGRRGRVGVGEEERGRQKATKRTTTREMLRWEETRREGRGIRGSSRGGREGGRALGDRGGRRFCTHGLVTASLCLPLHKLQGVASLCW